MEQQKTKLGINFGFRGWMLLIFEVTAFLVFQAFTNFPMNMLAEFYTHLPKEQASAALAPIMTAGTLVGIVIQLVLSNFVGKMKSVKPMVLAFGCLTLISALGVAALPFGTPWKAAYFLVSVFANIYGMFGIGILIGQWFPTRKGVFMGIATFAFPVCNGLMGPFAALVFPENAAPNPFIGFLPFLIVGLVGWVLGLVFISDYPEQVGCYRDNDQSFTKEKADAMLAAEIENKKTTVWKLGNTLKTGSFWLITIPMGTLLMCSVGMMTTTDAIIGAYEGLDFGMVMGMVMIFALIGSFLLGLVDGKFGTKTAILISEAIMLVSGILGGLGNETTAMISIILLAIFMGAGSNFTVSGAAQYWRREDFSTVFGIVNPVANVLQCVGPMVMAAAIAIGFEQGMGVTLPFWITAVIAAISIVLILLFQPVKVKEADDKYRKAAGKPLDNALVGRK